jgi:hypothetical protein
LTFLSTSIERTFFESASPNSPNKERSYKSYPNKPLVKSKDLERDSEFRRHFSKKRDKMREDAL